MPADWEAGKAKFADFMAQRQGGLDKMYLQNLYEQNRARKEAQDAAKPSFGKFLSGAIPGALMGALMPGVGWAGAAALGLGGGLSGSGMLGPELRQMTPSLLQMGAMGLGKMGSAGTPPMSAAGGPLQTYQPGAEPATLAAPPPIWGGQELNQTMAPPPMSPYGMDPWLTSMR